MKLFRGDNIHNSDTKPGQFRSLGLTTKAFGAGGDAENIEKLGLLKTVKIHIEKSDLKYYNITDYLSFSECENRALFWCSNRNTLELEKASDYSETRYLFKMEVEPKEIGNGIYYFKFKCNPELKKSDSIENKHVEIMPYFKKCPICDGVTICHKIILINSYEYLMAHPNHEGHEKALQYAKNDCEWLILPNDFMENRKHRRTQIPRADFWSADLYKVTGENRPNNVDTLTGKIW